VKTNPNEGASADSVYRAYADVWRDGGSVHATVADCCLDAHYLWCSSLDHWAGY
jgi:hypothetical protein